MSLPLIPIWKSSPFTRLLPPFITGILAQWYITLPPTLLLFALIALTLALSAFQRIPAYHRFHLKWLPGAIINLLITITGCCITFFHFPENSRHWLPAVYPPHGKITAVIQEPITPKNRSFKTIASARQLTMNGNSQPVQGNIILYFTQPQPLLSYGSTIIINKPLTPVKNSGNPAAFNYRRYCLFNQTAFQVHLQPADFAIAAPVETRYVKQFIIGCRSAAIGILRRYISPTEQGLAEALLIGYKDEMDKELHQAYANTGVVHVIAVSGMHLGLIYLLLAAALKPLSGKRTKWAGVVLILCGLWTFALMAGAGPSVIRSAVMFTTIIIGKAFSRQNSIYNNLAASAFLLLCWNPFWLWDIGFQLSYAAVLSIVIFFRPIYNLLFIRNRLLDTIWKLNAVTIAAQILTTPLSIYHFHQFPVWFLPANMVAVPVSSILLLAEIGLCAISLLPVPAAWLGAAISHTIRWLNVFIASMNDMPFASWHHLQLTVFQVITLFAVIAAAAYFIMRNHRKAVMIGLTSLGLFLAARTYSFISALQQRNIIIYNIPRNTAIDLVDGRHYYYMGDSLPQQDPSIRRFHLEPSRTLHRVTEAGNLAPAPEENLLLSFYGKRILLAGSALPLLPDMQADVLVLSGNPRISLASLAGSMRFSYIVADGSNSYYNLNRWTKEADSLQLPFHNTVENGAFMLACR